MLSRFIPVFIGFIAAYGAESSLDNCPSTMRSMRVGLRHMENKGIGYHTGYTTLETFLAPPPEFWPVTPFIDLRGHVFNSGKWAANGGLGLRGDVWGVVYGANVYYDYRQTNRKNYNQVSFGLEALSKWVDGRINGYFPVGKTITSPYHTRFDEFRGNIFYVRQRFQYALTGGNGEIGIHFPSGGDTNSYIAGGPYYLIGKRGTGIWGGQARINVTLKKYLTVDLSYSYDRVFKNIVQGQIGLKYTFGPKAPERKKDTRSCSQKRIIEKRMLAPVNKFEIIPVNSSGNSSPGIDPATGLPYQFIFVNNTSSSLGTYESPYPTLAEAEANSVPGDIIYVFPGDGTTKGMNSGITLQANQKFWGSGISYPVQTSEGLVVIPAQSDSSPTITNTNFDTDGNAINLATNNAVSGFTITSALTDAIYGTDPQTLEISSCTIENTSRFAVETLSSGDASISLTNNRFVNNINGISLTLDGTSTVVCSNNTFEGQTSDSEAPIEISSNNNSVTMRVENNIFNNNKIGSILLSINNVIDADLTVLNNTMTNNGTGSRDRLGSAFVVVSSGVTDHCSIELTDNTFSNNTSDAFYMHTDGVITTLEVTASGNAMSGNGRAALALATPVDHLTLIATNNTITGGNDHAIGVSNTTLLTSTGNITINNNTITNMKNSSSGIAIAQSFSTLNLTASDNTINNCEGSGIFMYAGVGTNNSVTCNASGNTISNCQNLSSNASSGISLDTYVDLTSTISNNTFSNNATPSVSVGVYTGGNPTVCLNLTGNSSNTDPGYSLTNSGSRVFNLSPCNVEEVNIGTINTSGTITPVRSCPEGIPCS